MQWNGASSPQGPERRPALRGVLDLLQERARPFIERQPEFARPAYGSVLQSGADMLPGVGDVVAVEDLQSAAQSNDWGGIGLGLLSALPGIPAIGKGVRRGRGAARRGIGLMDAAPTPPAPVGLMGRSEADDALARYRAANPDDTGARVLSPGDEGYPTNAQWDEASQAYVAPRAEPAPEPTYPIRAYHGSPHSFDRFSMDAIGTGEGAQAYGHGMYFTETEDVARGYRDQLSDDVLFRADGSAWNPNNLRHLNIRVAARNNGPNIDATIARARELASSDSPAAAMALADLRDLEALRDQGGFRPDGLRLNGRPLQEAYDQINNRAARMAPDAAAREYDRLALIEQLMMDGDTSSILGSRRDEYDPQAIDWFEREVAPNFSRNGSMYEVGIDAQPDTFLDWDRPMTEQPEGVRTAIEDILANVPGVRDNLQSYEVNTGPDNGQNLLGAFSEARPGDYRTAMTDELRQRGVNGIRYLDGNSRSVGEGSRNYVVFNDALIKVLRKYGISGLGLGLGAGVVANQSPDGSSGL